MKYTQPVILGSEHGVTFVGSPDYYLSPTLRETLKNNPDRVLMRGKCFYHRDRYYLVPENGAVICTPLHAALFAKD